MEKRVIATENLYQGRAILENRLMELHELLLNNQLTRRDAINANPSFVETREYDDLINEAIALKGQIEIFKNASKEVADLLKGLQGE